MIWLALALAQAHPAAKYGPAKLIIMPPNQPAVIIQYASMARCQLARDELIRQAREGSPDAAKAAEKLGRPVIVQHLIAYCIPA